MQKSVSDIIREAAEAPPLTIQRPLYIAKRPREASDPEAVGFLHTPFVIVDSICSLNWIDAQTGSDRQTTPKFIAALEAESKRWKHTRHPLN